MQVGSGAVSMIGCVDRFGCA